MITISNIKIVDIENKSRLCADIDYNNKATTLWYEVNKEYKNFLCYERADAFLLALLLYAMEKEEDIKVIGTPITSKLYFNVINYIIPVMAKSDKCYHKINIFTEISSEKLKNYGANGTGISRGVDSFDTLKEYTENCIEEMKVNWLTFFNVGSHGFEGGDESRKLFQKRRALSKAFAEKYNFNFIDIDSNISEYIRQIFVETHDFRSMSAVFAIQKLFKNYYYSSGYPITDFTINTKYIAHFETFLFQYLSNENLMIYSSGCMRNRIEKVSNIIDYKFAEDNLNVCFKDEYNCGECEKCIRTLFEIYANKGIEKFRKVFDVDKFYKSINWYEYMFMKNYYLKKQDYIDTYNLMKKNNIKIKLKNKIKAFIFISGERILPTAIVKKIKNRRKE